MSDIISRAEAIDVVARAVWHYPNECYKNLNVYEVAEALVSDAINLLPSAEPKTGWIPVSERLPSKDGCYLVSTIGTNNDIIDIAYYTEEIWHKASRIKAWMPLPEPYREDREE